MSNVSLSSLAAQQRQLERQRRNSTLLSVLVSVLVLALLMAVLAIFVLPAIRKETQVVVAYSAAAVDEEQPQKKTVTKAQAKPSAPSSAMARVVSAETFSPTAVPVPDIEVSEVSLDFGSGDDFGAGWETAEMDAGAGGEVSFFETKVSAQRIAYVIDYSKSMGKTKTELMKEELSKSIKQLKPGIQYQMIFFSGPAWVAGSTVDDPQDAASSVTDPEGEVYEWTRNGPDGKAQKAEWIDYSMSARNESLDHIEETPLSLGTRWFPPMEMALDMRPPPQIIFFMTDGTGGGGMDTAEEIVKIARRRRVIINTVAMMEPKAEEAMAYIAKETDGQFSIVDKDGRSKVQDFGDED